MTVATVIDILPGDRVRRTDTNRRARVIEEVQEPENLMHVQYMDGKEEWISVDLLARIPDGD